MRNRKMPCNDPGHAFADGKPRKRRITSIEALDPKTGKVWHWVYAASEQMLDLIKLEGLTVTKINGREVKQRK